MIGIGIGVPFSTKYTPSGGGGGGNPIPGLSPAAYYQFNTGITVTGSGVSQWNDQSGNARHLLQANDPDRPSKQGDGTILFDGVSHFLKASPFTLNIPVTVCVRMKQVTWTVTDVFFDGDTSASANINQSAASPAIQMLNSESTDGNLALNTYATVCAVFNGASSLIQVNTNTPTNVTDVTPTNLGGFTLGARGGGTRQSNIQVKEVAVFPIALDSTQRAAVITYMNTL